jgi:glycosyltransferase involved in cell wall biosynthesis
LRPPLLSILLPVYNVGPYLAECIHSIFGQPADEPFEVILLDDGSSDNSLELAQQLQSQYDGRLTVLRHPDNRGISAARNGLLDAARGTYVWHVDPDDWMYATALNRLFAILRKEEPDLVLCDFSKKEGKKTVSFNGVANSLEQDREALVFGIFSARKMHCWSKVSKRTLWRDGPENDLRFPNGKVFEDISSTPYLLLRARKYYYAPEKWIFYRQRRDSILGLLSRGKGFDEERHNQLANALVGFKEKLQQELGEVSAETKFAIGHFLARSYSQIAFKLLRERMFKQSWSKTRQMMGEYEAITESASILTFSQLQRVYRERGVYVRAAVLGLFRSIALSAPHKPVAESGIASVTFASENTDLSVEPAAKTR